MKKPTQTDTNSSRYDPFLNQSEEVQFNSIQSTGDKRSTGDKAAVLFPPCSRRPGAQHCFQRAIHAGMAFDGGGLGLKNTIQMGKNCPQNGPKGAQHEVKTAPKRRQTMPKRCQNDHQVNRKRPRNDSNVVPKWPTKAQKQRCR